MAIEPDTKDWTWVLKRPCPECGFDASTVPCRSIAAELRISGRAWRQLLDRAQVRWRPAPDVWSALEYGCHVRDVFKLYDWRLGLMLAEDDPLFENWDQDRASVEGSYGDEDPRVVTYEIETEGDRLASSLGRVTANEWSRKGRRSDGAVFTIDSFSRYLLHDPVHHIQDVERGYALLATAGSARGR
ncbi:MAG TPA: DinB family protein [Chloroflexota bacterium]|jgi:hypothetical protein|nr:DinB family protein [Chloroflexota bacterium]